MVVPMQSSISRDEAVAAIREDWDDVYFVSGRGKLAAYDPDCLFKVRCEDE